LLSSAAAATLFTKNYPSAVRASALNVVCRAADIFGIETAFLNHFRMVFLIIYTLILLSLHICIVAFLFS
jgi:hypothetical protein